MKKVIFILFQIFLINCYSQNKENEKTKTDFKIEEYIRASSKRYKNFRLKNIYDFQRNYDSQDSVCRRLADSLKVDKNYYEADFDNNGLKDFLVIGDDYNCDESRTISCNLACLVVMSFPKDSIKMYKINIGSGCLVPKIEKKNNQTILQVYNRRRGILSAKGHNIENHTLIYKFDGFVDYNVKSVKHSIEKIEFSTFGCYGICPVFSIDIDNTRNSTFFADRFNFGSEEEIWKKMTSYNREGTFKTVIKEDDYNQILELLEYMDFASFNNENMGYEEDSTHSIVKITYDKDKVKIIENYGSIGSYSLYKLYSLFFELRFNQKWK